MLENVGTAYAAQTIELKQYVDETLALVVSRQDSADSRLAALRQGAVHDRNVQAVVRRQQRLLDKLDPASRSLSVIGFTDMDPKSRVQLLESLMADTVHELDYVQIDHVMKGPHKDRKFTPISYIEFNNNDDRERALRIISSRGVTLVDSKSSTLRFNRLKSDKQIHRNYCLKKAKDMLENDPRVQGKSVSINWKLEISKDRNVVVDGCVCFLPKPDDLSGSFVDAFTNLHIE